MDRTLHIAIAIGLVERMKDADLSKAFSNNGKPLTAKQARRHLADLREQGFTFVPPCDDHDETGRCRGHNPQISVTIT